MEYIIGILLLISFVGLAVYAVRGGNLMMGMLIMAIIWTVLPLIGNTFATNPEFIGSYPGITDISVVDAITKVFQSGPEGWGNVLVNVVFGAWFGRVLLQTGIADALIRKAVELGGDKPVIICVLLSTVTTAIFSTLFGAGAVVAIGVIILPILMSLGKKGFIKVQRNDGKAILCKAGSYRNIVSQLWEELAIYQQDAILRPDYYICAGARVMDFSGSVDLDKIMMLMEVEMQMIDPGDDVIIVGAKNSL